MQVLNRNEVEEQKENMVRAIKAGSIFIYPTDTIYGLGCNALIDESVEHLREIKNREQKPFSVIAPSKEWIIENCTVERKEIDAYLPGPYTLFLKSSEGSVSSLVNPEGNTLGVRIPKHWFTEIISLAGVPFVTTSVNISGAEHMKKLEDLDQRIKASVDYCIYEGENFGAPSTKINLVS